MPNRLQILADRKIAMTSLRFGIEFAFIPTGRLAIARNFDFSIHTTIRNFDHEDFTCLNVHIKCYNNFFQNRIAVRSCSVRRALD